MYNHLTHLERCQIYALNKRGISQRAIASDLGRNVSTVSRELRRNKGLRGYRHDQAQRVSESRQQTANKRPSKLTGDVLKCVLTKLIGFQWSPEQISGWFKKHPEHGVTVSHETIYQHIWQDKRVGGSLYKHLRHRGKKYNKRLHVHKRRGIIPNRRDISERPAIVEQKIRIGDWEADTIIGKNHQGALLSFVDRASKITMLAKLPAKKSGDVEVTLNSRMKDFKDLVHTITFDNGMEFANHQNIARVLDTQCFFAKPYHSWQRGLNEHTNGLVRQYFPKNTNLAMVTHGQVAKVQWLLNNRPRKILNFKTPVEVFYANLAKLTKQTVALRS